MKTAEEHLLKQFGCTKKTQLMTEHFIGLTVINGVLEAMKLFAQEACREQREICAREAQIENFEYVPQIDEDSIKNAPEPTLS